MNKTNDMNKTEELEKRRIKAENLPKEELEKYIEKYFDICAELNKRYRRTDRVVIASLILHSLEHYYGGKMDSGKTKSKIENYIFEALRYRDCFYKIQSVVDYLDGYRYPIDKEYTCYSWETNR